MFISAALCIILILCLIAYIAGITILIIIPLFFCTHYSKIIKGSSELNQSSELDTTLKSYDPNALTIIHVPPGKQFLSIKKNLDDKIKLMADAIYKEHNLKPPNLNHLILRSGADNVLYKWNFDKKTSDEYMTHRELSEDYPLKPSNPNHENSIEIIFTPIQKETGMTYQKLVDLICRYTIILNIRELTQEEIDIGLNAIKLFNAGQLTEPEMTFIKPTGESYKSNTCYKPISDSDARKALHWGQRKLLLSEIDFINRAALDMGVDKFKQEKIAILYPGSAHGDHLMILMELYPNITLYLWDPALYNNILYLAEFARRNLPMPSHAKYTKYEIDLAKKYTDRIFINMELTDVDFIQYHQNSMTNNIHKNWKTQHGFFLDTSIKYFQEHRVKNNDTSKILFISDIRMYSNQDIHRFIRPNKIPESRNPIMQYFSDLLAVKDYTRDMDLQKKWFLESKSDYGLFKFKLAYLSSAPSDMFIEYLDGDIIIQTWGPETTTETRLFVKPNRKPAAYYNIMQYRSMMRYVNDTQRMRDISSYTLNKLNIDIHKKEKITLGCIWNDFIPSNKVGLDALIETYILYDYLKMYKKEITQVDLMLIISDITQTLINKSDQIGILRYMSSSISHSVQQNIFKHRRKYHTRFNSRLDYSSARTDKNICNIKRPQ